MSPLKRRGGGERVFSGFFRLGFLPLFQGGGGGAFSLGGGGEEKINPGVFPKGRRVGKKVWGGTLSKRVWKIKWF